MEPTTWVNRINRLLQTFAKKMLLVLNSIFMLNDSTSTICDVFMLEQFAGEVQLVGITNLYFGITPWVFPEFTVI